MLLIGSEKGEIIFPNTIREVQKVLGRGFEQLGDEGIILNKAIIRKEGADYILFHTLGKGVEIRKSIWYNL